LTTKSLMFILKQSPTRTGRTDMLFRNCLMIVALLFSAASAAKDKPKPEPKKILTFLFLSASRVQVRWEAPTLTDDQCDQVEKELTKTDGISGPDVQPNSLEASISGDNFLALHGIGFALQPHLGGSLVLEAYAGNKVKTPKR
jgi:hypothetical protein